MKVVILCGGKGTRLKEYTEELPKPLVEIGGKPILWHIMKIYASHGFDEFILCLGYKGDAIKKYFVEERWKTNDFTLATGWGHEIKYHSDGSEKWKITFVDTGQHTTKAERLLMIKKYLQGDKNFFLAYGDDVSNVNIKKILDYHLKKNKIVTLTAINPESQFGILGLNENKEITEFKEKPKLDHWINGGFFVFNNKIFDYIKKDYDLEKETFEDLVKERKICAYHHDGFWKSMNTFKDTMELNELWQQNKAPWKIWK